VAASDTVLGKAIVLGPNDGKSYWQPVPANGFARNLFNDSTTGSVHKYSLSVQTIAPGCHIREHTHDRNDEAAYVVAGKGFFQIDGEDHAVEAGSAVFVGYNRRHKWINPGPEPLTFLALFMPGGLDAFFAEIGRERQPGEAAPEPFARPANISEIEARSVFGWTDLERPKRQGS
jgi:quercetin dioxygenase-like cupin family protein